MLYALVVSDTCCVVKSACQPTALLLSFACSTLQFSSASLLGCNSKDVSQRCFATPGFDTSPVHGDRDTRHVTLMTALESQQCHPSLSVPACYATCARTVILGVARAITACFRCRDTCFIMSTAGGACSCNLNICYVRLLSSGDATLVWASPRAASLVQCSCWHVLHCTALTPRFFVTLTNMQPDLKNFISGCRCTVANNADQVCQSETK